MWDPPRSGIKPVSPALAEGFFTTEPQGSLVLPFFKRSLLSWSFCCLFHLILCVCVCVRVCVCVCVCLLRQVQLIPCPFDHRLLIHSELYWVLMEVPVLHSETSEIELLKNPRWGLGRRWICFICGMKSIQVLRISRVNDGTDQLNIYGTHSISFSSGECIGFYFPVSPAIGCGCMMEFMPQECLQCWCVPCSGLAHKTFLCNFTSLPYPLIRS